MPRLPKVLLAMIALALSALATALLPQEALAQGHGRGGGPRGGPAPRPVIVGGGFYGAPFWGFGWGYGFSPLYPPAWYGPEGGVDRNAAMIAGVGALDFDIKPGQAEVWVDGKFVAEARDLDGYPSFLWLPEGAHRVVLYKGGYRRYDETIEVRRGMTTQVKLKMEAGEAEPPGERKDRKEKKEDKAALGFPF
jgi:hypothetical protein